MNPGLLRYEVICMRICFLIIVISGFYSYSNSKKNIYQMSYNNFANDKKQKHELIVLCNDLFL